LHVAVIAALLQMAGPAFADQAVDLGSVGAAGGKEKVVDVNSAVYQAPTQTSLEATQPQSIISQHFIEENTAAGANAGICDLFPVRKTIKTPSRRAPIHAGIYFFVDQNLRHFVGSTRWPSRG